MIPSAFFAMAAYIYFTFMWGFFSNYIRIVSLGLTLKEAVSRRQAQMTYRIKDLTEDLTIRQRFANVWRLITRMKNYKSNIPSFIR